MFRLHINCGDLRRQPRDRLQLAHYAALLLVLQAQLLSELGCGYAYGPSDRSLYLRVARRLRLRHSTRVASNNYCGLYHGTCAPRQANRSSLYAQAALTVPGRPRGPPEGLLSPSPKAYWRFSPKIVRYIKTL